MPVRQLPARPDLDQLKRQAKNLLRDLHRGDADAIAEAREFHPEPLDPQHAQLADAQLIVARRYGAASWPRLIVVCDVLEAIDRDDIDRIRTIVAAHPEVFDDSSRNAAWRSLLNEVASRALRRVVETMRHRGAHDVDAVMARPELHSLLDSVRLLGRVGAQFPPDAIGGAVESLNGANFAFMVETGSDFRDEHGDWRSRTALALETYARFPAGKHRILETMVEHGVRLPDTPPMAVHRGRLDLLDVHLRRDGKLLERTFTHDDIYPASLGCHGDHDLALHGAQLGGATLLHMAADFEEDDIVAWLLERGMDPNVRADVDQSGIGGHTALFNCVVTYNAGRRDVKIAELLLARGADPNVRASLRKRLAFATDSSMHEYRDVTALAWGRRFHDQSYVSSAALAVIEAHGGHE